MHWWRRIWFPMSFNKIVVIFMLVEWESLISRREVLYVASKLLSKSWLRPREERRRKGNHICRFNQVEKFFHMKDGNGGSRKDLKRVRDREKGEGGEGEKNGGPFLTPFFSFWIFFNLGLSYITSTTKQHLCFCLIALYGSTYYYTTYSKRFWAAT